MGERADQTGLAVDVASAESSVTALIPEWQALAEAGSAQPFSVPDVALAWWKHLGRGRLEVVTIRREGSLVALVPLHVRSVAGLDVMRWVGHGLGVVGDVLRGPGDDDTLDRAVELLWAAVTGRRRVLDLIDCRLGGAGFDPLLTSLGRRARCRPNDRCPVIDLTGCTSVEELLALPGRRKLRQNMARADRAVETADSPVTVELHTERAELLALTDDLVAVHDAAEAAKPRVHLLQGDRRLFVTEVVDRLGASGRVAAVVVRLDGRPVGFHLALRTGRRATAWLARFDPVAAAYSPGHLMLRSVTQWAIESGLDELDLQLGDDAYKLRWATSTYDTADIAASAVPRLGSTVVDGVNRAHRWRR